MPTDVRPPTGSLFPDLMNAPWWAPLEALSRHAGAAGGRADELTLDLAVALAVAGHADPATAAATDLLSGRSVLAEYAGRPLPGGLAALVRRELARVADVVRRAGAAARSAGSHGGGGTAPHLSELAEGRLEPWAATHVARLAEALTATGEAAPSAVYLDLLGTVGSGPVALHAVTRWRSGRLEPVLHPDLPDWATLVGLEGPLGSLARNTETLLAGGRANDCLLYGARGSGKSTAVRGLARRYAEGGLRLVELQPEQLDSLPELVELLRPQPLGFVLFVDDLAFEADDGRYRPLKSLLEGGVTHRPENVALYATSNRRHLVRERLRDRPDPLDDDVHAWDTHHERLALADRFGLVITFPAADQRAYLEVVRALAAESGVGAKDTELDELALRFAEWNNGYSGRAARQFVDTLLSGL